MNWYANNSNFFPKKLFFSKGIFVWRTDVSLSVFLGIKKKISLNRLNLRPHAMFEKSTFIPHNIVRVCHYDDMDTWPPIKYQRTQIRYATVLGGYQEISAISGQIFGEQCLQDSGSRKGTDTWKYVRTVCVRDLIVFTEVDARVEPGYLTQLKHIIFVICSFIVYPDTCVSYTKQC